jgi:hypothetical protein
VEQDAAHRGGGEAVAEAEEFPSNALLAPARILTGQTQDSLAKAHRDRRSAGRAVRISPAPGDQISVPAQQRRRSHDEHAPRRAAQQPRQRGEKDSIGPVKIRSVSVAAEHGDLVAQDEDFDLLGSVTAQYQNQELEDASQRGVGKRPEHVR